MARNSRVVNMGKMKWVVIAALLFAAPALAIRYPSPAFTAVTNQGRPLTGATVTVTDSVGDPVTAYSAATGSAEIVTMPSTGIFQFFNDPGDYHVTIAGSGITRSFAATIPVTSGGLTDADFSGTGLMRKVSAGVYVTTKVNLTATTDPGVNDDGANGYSVGSLWINTTADSVFFCTDSTTGAANWVTNTSNIAAINGQTGPLILAITGSLGSDFNIATTTNLLTFNLPSASLTARGLVTTGSQSLAGPKTFTDLMLATDGFLAATASHINAINVDHDNDLVEFFTTGTAGWVNIDAPSGSKAALFVQNLDTGNGLEAYSGSGVKFGAAGIATASSTGAGIYGLSVGNGASAGYLTRSLASATVPVSVITRSNSSDTQSLLEMLDTTSTTASTYVWDYKLNGVVKGALQPNGQFIATSSSTPTYSFLGDTDSGVSNTGGNVCLVDESVNAVCASATGVTITGGIGITTSSTVPITITNFGSNNDIAVNTNQFVLKAGELKFSGVSGDGTGKVLCVKSDGNVGTCSDAPNGSGVCTCA